MVNELRPIPVLFNMAHGGVTASISVKEAQSWGFRIIIFPTLALNEVYKSVAKAFQGLRTEGNFLYDQKKGDPSLKQMFEVCGLQEAMDFDTMAGGDMYFNGV